MSDIADKDRVLAAESAIMGLAEALSRHEARAAEAEIASRKLEEAAGTVRSAAEAGAAKMDEAVQPLHAAEESLKYLADSYAAVRKDVEKMHYRLEQASASMTAAETALLDGSKQAAEQTREALAAIAAEQAAAKKQASEALGAVQAGVEAERKTLAAVESMLGGVQAQFEKQAAAVKAIEARAAQLAQRLTIGLAVQAVVIVMLVLLLLRK
jgi:chromosome segregation ATPase